MHFRRLGLLPETSRLGKEGFDAKGCSVDWNLNFLPCLGPLRWAFTLENPAFCAKVFKEQSLQRIERGGLELIRTGDEMFR